MEVVWNPWATAGIAAMFVAWALAAFVYRSGPERSVNRRLSILLAVEGSVAGGGGGLMYLMSTPQDAFAMMAITVTASIALLPIYLVFLATLSTPLTVPFRNPAVTGTVFLASAALAAYWFMEPQAFIAGMTPEWYLWYTPYEAVPGIGFIALTLLSGLLYLYGLVATFDAYRRTPRQAATRNQHKAYLVAFGTRDTLYVFTILTGLRIIPLPGDLFFFTIVLTPCVTIAFVTLLAYGILRTQLFDIDVKIKATLKQSTIAAIFIAVFFMVSEGAAVFFQDWSGSTFLGIAAAGLLVFVLAPLQRLAERVGDAAMPDVAETPDYFAYRKMTVFRAALESALQDGEMTTRERLTLTRLMAELGITPQDAAAMEQDVLRAAGRPASA